MANRTIVLTINDEHISGAGGILGTVGSGNAVTLKLKFNSYWDGYEKSLYFTDADGEVSVRTLLTDDMVDDDGYYRATVPQEAVALPGKATITVQGIDDTDRIAATASILLKVLQGDIPTEYSNASVITEDIVAQLQSGYDAAVEKSKEWAEAAEASAESITTMTVSASGLEAGEDPTVTRTETETGINLAFGIPKGDKGDTGEQGVQGPQGETGAKGDKGDKGDAGAQGPQGERGYPGIQGATGATGPQGVKGDIGYSISHTYRKSGTGASGTTDTYSVVINDGASTEIGTYTVYNGRDGEKGEPGKDSDMLQSVYDPAGGERQVAFADEFVYKQDTIPDLKTIRAGAALGATALQSYTETDPTVPDWAKASTKPAYTAAEITDGESTAAAEISELNGNIVDEQTARIAADALKADKTALAKTDQSLKWLWEFNEGKTCDFYTDSDEAYLKTIPDGAKVVSVQDVGGKSVVWNQLNNPSSWKARNGVTPSYSDNIVTLSGENTASYGSFCPATTVSGHVYLQLLTLIENPNGLSFKFGSLNDLKSCEISAVGKYSKVSSTTRATESIGFEGLTVGTVIDGVKLSYFLFDMTQMFGCTATTDVTTAMTDWCEQYAADHPEYNAGEIVSADVDEVDVVGKNLLNCNAEKETFDLTGDGKTLRYGYSFPGGVAYAVTAMPTGSIYYRIVKKDLSDRGTTNSISASTSKIITVDTDSMLWMFYTDKEYSFAGGQVEKGTTATDYSPYSLTTLSVPSAVRALPGYGLTGNVVSYADKTYTQTTYADGTEVKTLDTPVVTDISSLLTDAPICDPCECEAGGSVTIHNAALLPTPNAEEYLISLAEVEE